MEDLGLDGRIHLKRMLRNKMEGRGLLSSGCGWKKWWAVTNTAVKPRVTSWSQSDVCVQKIQTSVTRRQIIDNPLTPNDPYRGRTVPLTSKRCILYIYSTNIGTEYFKHGIYSPFFPLQNAVCFIILTHLVPVLFTFYIQVC